MENIKRQIMKKIALLLAMILVAFSPLTNLTVNNAKAASTSLKAVIGDYTYTYIVTSESTCSIESVVCNTTTNKLIIPQTIDGYQVTKLGESYGIMEDNTNIDTIILPEGLVEIGTCALRYYKNVHAIQFPNSLRKIGERALYGSGLREVNIPDSVVEIGENSFYDCDAITSIKIGSGLKVVGFRPFFSSNHQMITLDVNCSIIADNMFSYQEIGSGSCIMDVHIGPNVRSIGNLAFQNQRNLNHVTFEEGLISIGRDAFENTSLGTVTIPSTVQSIGGGCFGSSASIYKILSKDVGIAATDSGCALGGGSGYNPVVLYGYPESTTEMFYNSIKDSWTNYKFISLLDDKYEKLQSYEEILENVREKLNTQDNEAILGKIDELKEKLHEVQEQYNDEHNKVVKLEIELDEAIEQLKNQGGESGASSEELEKLKEEKKQLDKEILALNYKINDLNAQVSGKDVTITTLTSILSTLSTSVGTLSNLVSQYDKQFEEIREELQVVSNKDILPAIRSLADKVSSLQRDNMKLIEEKKELEERLATESDKKDRLNQYVTQIKDLVQEETDEKALNKIEANIDKVEKQEEKIVNLEAEGKDLADKLSTAEQQIKDLQKQLASLSQTENPIDSTEKDELLAQIEELTQKANSLTEENKDLSVKIDTQETKINKVTKENEQLNAEIEALRSMISKSENDTYSLKQRNNELEEENRKLKEENEELKEQIRELNEMLGIEEENEISSDQDMMESQPTQTTQDEEAAEEERTKKQSQQISQDIRIEEKTNTNDNESDIPMG